MTLILLRIYATVNDLNIKFLLIPPFAWNIYKMYAHAQMSLLSLVVARFKKKQRGKKSSDGSPLSAGGSEGGGVLALSLPADLGSGMVFY